MMGILRGVLVTLMLGLAAPVEADDPVTFAEGNLFGDDWEQFTVYLEAQHPLIVNEVSEEQGLNREAALEFIRKYDMYVGRFDINGDGVEELFVTIFHGYVCGTAGCETVVFERKQGAWHALTSLSAVIAFGLPMLYVSDEAIGGYRTLYSDYDGLRWNGKEYASFCVRRCEKG